jgi:CBS domain-containing protein
MLGGLLVGAGGLIEPRALGVGYDVIADLLSGHMVMAAALSILLVKAVIWLVALSSGTSGGVLAPLLILGGTLGWMLGTQLPGDPGFWALLGMAAMMGGTMRSPLTGAAFAVELTGNVDALAPLLAATVAAYCVTVLLLKRSILTEKIARRGQHVIREYSIDPYELTRVKEIMTKKVDTLPADMPVSEALAFFMAVDHRHRMYPIVDADGRLLGAATRADALRWRMEHEQESRTLFDVVSDASTPVAYPDEVVARVADRMVAHDLGRVPVVEQATGRLIGLIARKDVVQMRLTTGSLERERQAFFLRTRGGGGTPTIPAASPPE